MKRRACRTVSLLVTGVAVLFLVLAWCAMTRTLDLEGGTSELDGVTGRIANVSTTFNEKTGATLFDFDVDISNDSDIDVMQVQYRLICLDKQGDELDDFAFTYNGQDKALAPGESVSDHKAFRTEFDGKVAGLKLELMGITSAEEMPPVRLPKVGEYLHEYLMAGGAPDITVVQPVSIVVGIDQGGFLQEATFDSPETVREAADALAKVKVGRETSEFVTDNYNYILIDFGEDQVHGLRLNLYNLEASAYENYHAYELEGLDALWSLAVERAEPVGQLGGS